MSKASVINTQNKRECRYCHERDHIKGYFDKRQQCYVTTCPKLIAKKNCENNQDSFRRQALLKSHLNRKKKMEAGEFVEQRKNKFSYNRVKSPGPLLKKNQNKFAFFNVVLLVHIVSQFSKCFSKVVQRVSTCDQHAILVYLSR